MTSYTVEISAEAAKKIKKLDRPTQRLIFSYINRNLRNTVSPRALGKGLTGPLRGLWRYRVGDYRLLVEIKDLEMVIIALDVGHRSSVYMKKN